MADKVGEIYYEAHVRGDRLPSELRKVGNKAGKDFGDEFSKSADARLRSSFSKMSNDLLPILRREGRISASGFTDAFENVLVNRIRGAQSEIAEIFARKNGLDEFAKGFKNADEAAASLRQRMSELNAEGGLNDQMYNRLGGTLNQWLGKARQAEAAESDLARARRESITALKLQIAEEEEHNRLAREQENSIRNRTGLLERLTNSWRKHRAEMDSNNKSADGLGRRMTRLTKIVLLVTAALPQLAALSSAAGAGLTLFAGAAIAGIAGLAGSIAALTFLNKDLAELPANLQGAASAFQAFKDVASGSLEALQGAAAGGLQFAFTSLQETLKALTPAIQVFGTAVGNVFANIAASLAPGTQGFALLDQGLRNMAPVFETLVQAAMNLTGALSSIFLTLAPYIQAFASYLADITQQFNDWANTAEGRSQLINWAQNAEMIFGALADLVGSLGTMLAGVVTPTLVSQFTTFIYTLSNFMPTLGGIIGLVEQLRIFDVLGAVFNALTPVINALLPSLGELANALGAGLISILNTTRPALTALATALAPIIEAITPLIPLIANLAVQLINFLVPAITPLLSTIGQLVAIIVESLGPALQPLIESFMALLPPILSIVNVILQALMPIIAPLLQLVGALGSVLLDQLLIPFQLIATVLEAVSPLLIIIATLVGALIETLVALITGDFQKVPEIWGDAWQVMSDAVQTMVDFVKPVWDAAVSFVRDSVANLAKFFGDTFKNINKGWSDFWNGLEGIVHDVWNGILSFIEGGINGTVDLINGLLKGINNVGGALGIHVNLLPKVKLPRFASGTIAYGRMQAIIGESGPEAVVPLNRPLSQVDPSVRDLSAYAQGKSTDNSVKKSVTFESGAFTVVTPSKNPELVASMVMDAITEDALN